LGLPLLGLRKFFGGEQPFFQKTFSLPEDFFDATLETVTAS
jgi:hypothetical protein